MSTADGYGQNLGCSWSNGLFPHEPLRQRSRHQILALAVSVVHWDLRDFSWRWMEDGAKSLLKIKEGWKEDAEHVSEFISTLRDIQSIQLKETFHSAIHEIKSKRQGAGSASLILSSVVIAIWRPIWWPLHSQGRKRNLSTGLCNYSLHLRSMMSDNTQKESKGSRGFNSHLSHVGRTFPLSVSLCWLDTWRKRYQNISQLRSQCKFHRTPWRDGSRCVETSNKMKEVSSAASSPPGRRCGRVLNVTSRRVAFWHGSKWFQASEFTQLLAWKPALPTNSRLLYWCFFFILNHQQQNEEHESSPSTAKPSQLNVPFLEPRFIFPDFGCSAGGTGATEDLATHHWEGSSVPGFRRIDEEKPW